VISLSVKTSIFPVRSGGQAQLDCRILRQPLEIDELQDELA